MAIIRYRRRPYGGYQVYDAESLGGLSFGAYGAFGDTASDMDNVLAQLNAQEKNLANALSSSYLTLPGTLKSASDALDQSDKTISYLSGPGRARVLSGDLTAAAWVDLANEAVNDMATAARLIGKDSIGHIAYESVAEIPRIVAQEVQDIATTAAGIAGKTAASALDPIKAYLPWIVGGAGLLAAILYWPAISRALGLATPRRKALADWSYTYEPEQGLE